MFCRIKPSPTPSGATTYLGVLSGFICAFHFAALGLSPKHTIYASIN